jgi:hypothetical protein
MSSDFSAEMEFHKIDPWNFPTSVNGKNFSLTVDGTTR